MAITNTHLIIEKVETKIGYTEIKLNKVDIVVDYDTIFHIINLKEIINIIDTLENNIKQADLGEKETILL